MTRDRATDRQPAPRPITLWENNSRSSSRACRKYRNRRQPWCPLPPPVRGSTRADSRVVVADSRTKRDGRAIEEIGKYHPTEEPSFIQIDSERAQYWLGVGAQPTDTVISLFKASGDWQKFSGDTSPSGIKPQPEPVDKVARFNAALAESDDEPASGAIAGKKKEASAEAAVESTESVEA